MAYNYPGGPGYARYYYGYYGPYWMATVRTDAEIAEDVRNRLVWDSWVNAEQIRVEVRHRVVSLTGDVDSIVEKRAAGDDAWDTPGVLDVDNQLRVSQPVMER
jgi:osmotically-inducible protein OsmY